MTPGQCRAARCYLRWSAEKLAKMAGISKTTVIRFEHGENVLYRSVEKMRGHFEAAGVEFVGRFGVHFEQDKP